MEPFSNQPARNSNISAYGVYQNERPDWGHKGPYEDATISGMVSVLLVVAQDMVAFPLASAP
jgi:hypothetical protein